MSRPMHKKRHDAILRYAQAEKSDPFAYNRAMTHHNNGVAGFTEKGEDAFYSADEHRETRYLPSTDGVTAGEAYQVPAYRNIQHP